MITPISNNLNTANGLSSIERPRVPRRNNAADNVSFAGKGKINPEKAAGGVKKFFGGIINSVRKGVSSIANTIKKGAHNIVNSKAVQTVKSGITKGFHKTVDVIKSTPKAIGGFFKKIANKFSKKA